MQFRVSPNLVNDTSAEEWQARVDLAAAHRLAFNEGFSEGIFNHLTLAVPGRSDRYYQIPFGMHWGEVTASSFMEVGIDDGEVKRGEGEVERSCYCIHAPIHKALPQAKAVFHTHMPYASALTRLEDPRIKEIGQTEVGLSGAIAYDDEYTGPALDPAEGVRLAGVIGDKKVLFMANHGISTVGATVADAYDMLYYIERAAQVQIYAMWTGQRARDAYHPPPPPPPPRARGREDQARFQGRASLQGPEPVAAPLRCVEAHARPQGAGLRDVVQRQSPPSSRPCAQMRNCASGDPCAVASRLDKAVRRLVRNH
jgi:ribulose-5-phosphate 4-epimerase/fuculose-1-phosphate aldolase